MSLPHLAVPFQFDQGGFAVAVDQDTLDDVAQCVAVLCATTTGTRTALPSYGIEDPVFSQQVDTAGISRAIATWEPRAYTAVSATGGPQAKVVVDVSVAGAPPTASAAVEVMPTVPPPSGLQPGTYDGASSVAPSGLVILDGQSQGQLLDGGGA